MAADETARGGRAEAAAGPSETEAALAESSERYRSLFTYSPRAVFSVDLEGAFTDANEVTQRLSGYSLAELELRDFSQLVIPEHRGRVLTAYARALAGEPQRLEATALTKQGRHLELNLAAVPVIVGGRVVGVHGIAENITERNELRRELERHRQTRTFSSCW